MWAFDRIQKSHILWLLFLGFASSRITREAMYFRSIVPDGLTPHVWTREAKVAQALRT